MRLNGRIARSILGCHNFGREECPIDRTFYISGGIMKSRLAAMGAVLLAASSSPALAQSGPSDGAIAVGFIDVGGKELTFPTDNVSVDFRHFTPEGHAAGVSKTDAGDDHGNVVMSAFVRESRKIDPGVPIKVFSADPTYMRTDADGDKQLTLSWNKAKEALGWFSENGVKVVVTTFYSKDEVGARGFVDEAQKLGMIVFSSGANRPGQGKIFPSGFTDVISVGDVEPGLAMLTDRKGIKSVKFGASGAVPRAENGADRIGQGSSFAVPRVAAYGSHYLMKKPNASREEVEGVLDQISKTVTDMNDSAKSYRFLGDNSTRRKLTKIVGQIQMASLPVKSQAKGKEEAEGALAIAFASRTSQAGR